MFGRQRRDDVKKQLFKSGGAGVRNRLVFGLDDLIGAQEDLFRQAGDFLFAGPRGQERDERLVTPAPVLQPYRAVVQSGGRIIADVFSLFRVEVAGETLEIFDDALGAPFKAFGRRVFHILELLVEPFGKLFAKVFALGFRGVADQNGCGVRRNALDGALPERPHLSKRIADCRPRDLAAFDQPGLVPEIIGIARQHIRPVPQHESANLAL